MSDRKLLLLCSIPYGLGIASFLLFLMLFFLYSSELTALIISDSRGWLFISAKWGIVLVSTILAGILALGFALIGGAWSIEIFILEIFRRQGIILSDHTSLPGIIKSTLRGFKNDLARLIYIGLLLVLMFICSFFPLLYIFPLFGAAFIIGSDILDLPCALLEIPFSERRKIIIKHVFEVLALGGLFSLLLLIPLGGVIFMPLAYYVGTERLAQWLARS